MLPTGVVASVWDSAGEPDLYPEESALVERALQSRKIEFARGRACARDALGQLGRSPGPIMVGESREPLWPHGFVGSITHCDGLVMAVAASTDNLHGIGLDAEPANPLPLSTRPLLLHPSEMFSDRRRPILETVVFSAKESIHKALFPSSRVWMDFLEVEVELDVDKGTYQVRAAATADLTDPYLDALAGRFVLVSGYVITLASATSSPTNPDPQ
jgi:enterobactin synthetase component D / holo-[acyl-carrier protein] synthase